MTFIHYPKTGKAVMRRFTVTRWHDPALALIRDLQAFDERSIRYDLGPRGAIHRRIADRTLDIAAQACPDPKRVLDVGCGTGYLLRRSLQRYHDARKFIGIDPAPEMIRIAESKTSPAGRSHFLRAFAEQLPFPDESFDLILSTTSFEHWGNQESGLRECYRTLAADGTLVITDLFSAALYPTLYFNRPGRVRTKKKMDALLVRSGFINVTWRNLSGVAPLTGFLLRTALSSKVESPLPASLRGIEKL